MKRRLAQLFFAGFLLMLGMAFPGASAFGQCLSKSETRAAIRSGQAIPMSDISSLMRARGYGRILQAQLCHERGKTVYYITTLSGDGISRRLIINARNGRILTAN